MKTKLTYKGALNLLGAIATSSKYIDYSFEINNSDPSIELQNHGTDTVMTIEEPKEYIKETEAGSRNVFSISFQIIKFRSTKAQIVINAREIKEECRLIAIKTISWLRNEMRQGNMPAFDPDGISMSPIDLYELNWHGYSVSIELSTPIDLSFDSNDWV